ncbi:aminotransferase class IV [Dokdonella sp.]|uniref:aminotransferase class IV n=1 Tax=Dokdonella sp. TaxID=2291710 RepID=UPI0025BA32E8|nr:aminotransferase class IV [Dokdonella sp.]MBX3693145.1 aminotransferase class IV [Dokdonella sp.]MCW5567482.1 aminotransferase class IV [Dokdonella sp.]
MSSRIEINGEPPRVEALAQLAQVNYGHFTTLQVRERRAQGFDLHLERLDAATRRLFGTPLDGGQVRTWVRRVLDDEPASLRITVFSQAFDREHSERNVPVDVLVTTGAGREPLRTPLQVTACVHERTMPGLKHVGTFDLHALRREARLAGSDDVLFTRVDGTIAEGSTWNLGLWDGVRVVWPLAPALDGVTRRLLDLGLRECGIESTHRPVRIDELASFSVAFASNTTSPVRPIVALAGHRFANDAAVLGRIERCIDARPWLPI